MILALLSSLVTFNGNLYATEENELKIGDYITYGSYNDAPLKWQVVHFDQKGNPLLVSANIISYKPFDSSESGEFGALDDDLDTLAARQQYGSNRWENSNIREWLNSNLSIVDYTTAFPTETGVWENSNDYAEEKGFLSNFTAKEQLCILPVLNTTIVSVNDEKYADYGQEAHEFVFGTAQEAFANYEECYQENTIDQVFLLSVYEVYQYLELGGFTTQRDATIEAYEQDESNRGMPPGTYDGYWLRDATGNSSTSVRSVTNNGKINYDSAYYNNVGIVPALYLNKALITIDSGDGTSVSPYTFNVTDDVVIFTDKNLESAIRDVIGKPSGTIYASDVHKITSLYASGRQINSIEGLEKLVNLKYLDLSYNEIADFSAVSGLYMLEELYAQYNQLDELTPIIEAVTNNLEPSDMTIDISGNLLDINDEANQSNFSYIKAKGAHLIYNSDIYNSAAIEALIGQYQSEKVENETDKKEQLVSDIEAEINAAGVLALEAEEAAIIIANDTFQEMAQNVIIGEKDAIRQLQDNDIYINREIHNTININVSKVDLSSPFTIEILEEVGDNTSIDQININLDDCVISFEPSKLSKDFLRDESIKINIVKSLSEEETTKVLGEYTEEDINLSLGHFVSTFKEMSQNVINEKSDKGSMIINDASMVLINEEMNVYDITFAKGDEVLTKINSRIAFGIRVEEEDAFSCMILENDEKQEQVGGIYNETDGTVYVEMNAAGRYYLISNKTSYNDIYDLDDEAILAIQALAAKNILLGREDVLFKPNDYISREEIAAAIVKLSFMYDDTAQSHFTDVKADSQYYYYISSSEKNGIINGYPDNTFRPNISIVNAELTKLTSAIMVYYEDYIYPTDVNAYLDVSTQAAIPEWVDDYLALAIREGITDIEANTYNSDEEITRAEAAKTLYKIFRKMK
jgi:hypothetical protein